MPETPPALQIDALLPQLQCGQCGHPACLPYAESVARGEAINRCLPGGQPVLEALASLLQRPLLPLAGPATPARIAFIREAECIGCTKCRQNCPTDAIAGAARLLHTVIRNQCTGCERCISACPVDCIELQLLDNNAALEQHSRAGQFRQRYLARQRRLNPEQNAQTATMASNPPEILQRLQRQRPALSEQQKQLQARANMARAALLRVERQLARQATPGLLAQLEQLREHCSQAEQALQQLANGQPDAEPQSRLRQAKQHYKIQRDALRQALQAKAAPPDLAELQAMLEQASRALEAAEAASGRPVPHRQYIDKHPMPQALRELKTRLAYARAELSRQLRRSPRDATALASARATLEALQRELTRQDTCGPESLYP